MISPTEMARAASTWRTSFGPWVASHSPTDSWSGRSRSAESTGDAAMCWRTSVTRISPSGMGWSEAMASALGVRLRSAHETVWMAGRRQHSVVEKRSSIRLTSCLST